MTEVPPGSSPVDRLTAGSRIREWRVERFLARGAFGQVFEASRDSWQREPTRALKVFDPIHSSAARASLVGEFAVLRDVRHPNLLAGEDAFDIDDGPLSGCVVFVLELADTDLASVVAREGSLPADQVADVGRQLASGLAALHEGGHLHGDVKPENALRVNGRWTLGDFGVSAAFHGSYAHPAGATLDYRPPEVVADHADGRVHRSADLWALGTTLWVAGTGHHPFVGSDAAVRHAAVLRGDRRPAPDLDGRLADLLDRRFLASDPHERVTAAEAADELGAVAGPSPTRPDVDRRGAPTRPSSEMTAEDVIRPTRPTTAAVEAAARTVVDRAEPARTELDAPARIGSARTELDRTELERSEPDRAAPRAEPVPPRPAVAGDSGRTAMALGLGGASGAILAEVISLLAAAAPAGLVVRRAIYLGLLVVITVGAAMLFRRLAAEVMRRYWVPAIVAAVVVEVLVTGYLFALA